MGYELLGMRTKIETEANAYHMGWIGDRSRPITSAEGYTLRRLSEFYAYSR